MTSALRMEAVQKSFRGYPVLRGIDWTVPAGSVCGLIGPNGAGKTTLLRLLLGLLWPDGGTIEALGEPLGRERADLRERVHYVASQRTSLPPFRVDEWLHYASLAYPKWDASRAARMVDALGIAPRHTVRDLSAGQRTSLQVAVAVATRPDLLLLDEPTNGLDVLVKGQVLKLVIDMAAAEGTTVVFATHHIEDVERLADRLAVLHDGRFIADDDLDAIKAGMKRLQVVFEGAWPAEIEQDPRVVHVERRGKVAMLTVDGPIDSVAQTLRESGAILVEPVGLDLTEVFRAMMEREGFARAQLQWDDE